LPINILLTPDTHPQATINFTLLAPLWQLNSTYLLTSSN
jgi:hypothetical protein